MADQAKTDLLVRAEKLRLLFQHSFVAVFVSIIMAAMLCKSLWLVQDQGVLIMWLCVLGLSSSFRLALFIAFRRQSPSLEDSLHWEKPYLLTLLLSSTIWGVGALYIMPEESAYHQLIIMFCLMGMVGGAIATYWTHRLLTLLTVAIVITPSTIWISLKSTAETPLVFTSFFALFLFVCLIRSSKVLSDTMTESLFKNHELVKEKEKVEFLARKDALTNLYNRRAFYERLNEYGAYCERHGESMSVIVADLDNFKNINDQYGHLAGDAALTAVGKVFKRFTRSSDICARLGGEEFGVLIRASSLEEASILAEKLRAAIESSPIEFEGQSFDITASFGVANGTTDFGNVVNNADKAMYLAKQQGRNQVVEASGQLIDIQDRLSQ